MISNERLLAPASRVFAKYFGTADPLLQVIRFVRDADQADREQAFARQVALGHLSAAVHSLREAQDLLVSVGDARRRVVSGAFLGANEAKLALLDEAGDADE